MLLARPVRLFLATWLISALTGGAVLAQLESGDRGIPPLDSSNTLEIGGIKVDVGGKDAAEARFNGWRLAQRQGFKALWAKTHRRPIGEAPSLPDSTLDGLVSSIIVEQEQIAPNRYIASLGVLFDRARAGALLGVAGQVRRSAPLLLIPVMVSGGTMTSVETRNPWQRAWAEFRTSASPVDYVRVAGMGADPLLITAAQTARPGRAWWRNLIDLYGAADVLVAEVRLKRLYPGGPASGTFIGFLGPDRKPLGTFTLTTPSSAGVPQMMSEGVQQMDALFARYLAAGQLSPDPSLIVPEAPPPPPEEDKLTETPQAAAPTNRLIQVVVTSPYSPVGWLRSIPGVISVQEIGSAVLVVNYRGSPGQLQAALAARGWRSDTATGVFRITGYAPPAPQPQPVAPAPTAPPVQPQPAPQPAPPRPQGTSG